MLASAGRPALLADALATVRAQRGLDFEIVVSVPDRESLPGDPALLEGATVVTGTRGLAAQRNAGLASLAPGTRVVAFFDDDSVLRDDWLVTAVDFLEQHPQVIGLTGRVLLDGAVTGEISPERTQQALAASRREPWSGRWRPWKELYGCNFAVRLDRMGDERFDERLPLYSWLEDHDMARRLMRRGVLAKVDDCVMVHRAAASGGRQNHVRLGYSQVMNPLYLASKGSFTWALAIGHLTRRVAKNALLSAVGGSRSWRRERFRGNALAALDFGRGHVTPERIVDL